MTKTLFATALLMAVGSMAIGADAAAPAPGAAAGGPPGGQMSPAERFKQIDKNSDGKLSLEEFSAMPAGRGGPGGAGGPPAEGAAPGGGQAGGAMSAADRFKAADTNADGSISVEEFTAMIAARRGGGMGGGMGGGQ